MFPAYEYELSNLDEIVLSSTGDEDGVCVGDDEGRNVGDFVGGGTVGASVGGCVIAS
jgi:hypothetical protein